MEQKEFYEKLTDIIEMLDTCRDGYTDMEYKDVRVYDRLNLLIENSQASESVKNDLRLAQNKIREAYLWLKDLVETLGLYD